MKSKFLTLPFVLSVALLMSACGKEEGEKGSAQQAAAGGAVAVVAVSLQSEDVPLFSEMPGRVTAFRVAEVRPQVSGIVLKRFFEEGSMVNAGDQLYQIDPATYEASLQSARAQLAEARANLKSVQARASRYAQLVKINAVSRQDYDDAVASAEQARAAILSAEAAVETARINVDYTKVYAPITGRIGSSSVTEGALVTANQAATMAQITQLDPIYVDVRQSSSELLQLRGALARGALRGPAQSAKVSLTLDGAALPYSEQGDLQFSDVTVDEKTGAVQVRAKFPNPDHLLYPGLFVRARIEQGVRENAILAPQQSVIRQSNGATTVWKIVDGKANMVPVETGPAIGDKWLILDGLSNGDMVVLEGIQKLRGNNIPVTVVAPQEQQAPQTGAQQ